MNLALINDRFLVQMHELDRVFDRQDVSPPLHVDLVGHRGERCALSRSRRISDEHEAVGQLRERLHHVRQTQLVERWDPLGYQTIDRRHRASLTEHIATEPSQSGNAERQINLFTALNACALDVCQTAVHERLRHIGSQRRTVGELLQLTLDAKPMAVPQL